MKLSKEDIMLEWTGERYTPWVADPLISYEHLHRYGFAREFVKGKKVLDLGCGEGYGSLILAEEAKEVIGADIDQVAVRHASLKYVRGNLRFIQGSIIDLPIKGKGVFDVIVCFEALEHIREHDELMKEVKRLLRSDGIFIISTPNKHTYSDQPNYQNPFHLKELYLDEFNGLLNANFNNTFIYGQRVYPASNIFPLFKDMGGMKGCAIEKNDKGFVFVPSERKEGRYFIGVSSDAHIRDAAGDSYLVDISEIFFKQFEQERKEHAAWAKSVEQEINNLRINYANLEAALNRIYESDGWKALEIYYKWKGRLLPVNSRMERMTRFVWNLFHNKSSKE